MKKKAQWICVNSYGFYIFFTMEAQSRYRCAFYYCRRGELIFTKGAKPIFPLVSSSSSFFCRFRTPLPWWSLQHSSKQERIQYCLNNTCVMSLSNASTILALAKFWKIVKEAMLHFPCGFTNSKEE